MKWVLIILAANFCVLAAYTDNVGFSIVNSTDEKNIAGGSVGDPLPANGSTSFDDVRCTTIDDVIAVRRSLCPAQCRCSPLDGQEVLTKLTVNCSGVVFNDSAAAASLSDELKLLLSRCTSELTELAVTNTLFTGIGRQNGICSLSKIRSLDLSWNRLRFLPKNCFTNMPNLTIFAADHNSIYFLQEGVFANLHQLRKLSLQHNFIRYIAPRVFDESANLSSLNIIILSYNIMTQLEPWPLIRALHRPTHVWLDHNRITNFTNALQWSYNCNRPNLSRHNYGLVLDLNFNNIKHITDAVEAWNIGFKGVFCLMWVKVNRTIYSRLNLDISNNPFNCDCKDYSFFLLSRTGYFSRSHWLDNLNCEDPSDLHNSKVNSVQLDRLICNETELCPPGCSCISRPYNDSLEISCPPSTLDSLPHTLHFPDKLWRKRNYTYDLRFGGSGMKYLESRDYLVNTSRLDVSNSQIEMITDDAWRLLQRIDSVDLSGNRLTTLPRLLQTDNITFRSIALHDNPLSCECDQRWLAAWLKSLGSSLRQPNSVLCHSPQWLNQKTILSLKSEDFCQDPEKERVLYTVEIVVPTVAGVVILVSVCFVMIYRCRVKVFAKFNVHPFDVDECKNENMAFDAFVSCAWPDDALAQAIVDRLEGGNVEEGDRGGYRVCYHSRDFPLGGVILGSIQQSIEHSKRVICVLSSAFLSSDFCMLEFRTAWQWNIEHGRHRLIVVKCPGVDEALAAAERDAVAGVDDVRMFLSTYTYIEHDSDDWWQKLLYAMPINRLPAVDQDFHFQFFAGADHNNDDEELLLSDL